MTGVQLVSHLTKKGLHQSVRVAQCSTLGKQERDRRYLCIAVKWPSTLLGDTFHQRRRVCDQRTIFMVDRQRWGRLWRHVDYHPMDLREHNVIGLHVIQHIAQSVQDCRMVSVAGSQISTIPVLLNLAHYMLSAIAQRSCRDSKFVIDGHVGLWSNSCGDRG